MNNNNLICPTWARPLNEANLNRIMWHGRHGFIIISANRSSISSEYNPEIDLTSDYEDWLESQRMQDSEDSREVYLKDRNKKAEESLLNDIKSSNYAYSKVFGGYHPKEGDAVDSYEPSFIVYNHDRSHSNNEKNWEDLKKFAIDMCAKYQQDSVYIQAPNEAPVYVNRHGQVVSSKSSQNFKFNRDEEEFYTTAKRDKNNPQRFTADIQFECRYISAGPTSYVDRMKRSKNGEVFLNE